ncbi:MAG TPA: helix-turn-helix domain-containing protein [Ktedonobacteraceae bacterium]|nr:helix-turn-helix domain-containing protein [Ktedonobacteraceae bacterium]
MTNQLSKPGRFTSTRQAAEVLGRDERTIRRWIEDNKIASIKRNGQRLIPQAEVERLRQGMPDLVGSTTDRILALEEHERSRDDRIAVLEQCQREQSALIQDLRRFIQQFPNTDPVARDHPRSIRTGPDRLSGAAKRGYPPGTVYLVEFARKHKLEEAISLLKELYWSKEIELSVYHRPNEPKRNNKEWWITPEQHLAVILYCVQHSIPCQCCEQCAVEQAAMS